MLFREMADHDLSIVIPFYERMINPTFMIKFLLSSLGGGTVTLLSPCTKMRKESKNVFPPATSRSGHV